MIWLLAALGVAVAGPLLAAVPALWPQVLAAPAAPLFGATALAGLLVGLVLHRAVPFLPILEHELTHMLAAICLLRRPLGVRADHAGGDTTYSGRGSTLIRVAPYVLPTVTLVALAARPILRADLQGPLVGVLGLTFGAHVFTGVVEAHPQQPDLRQGGLIPSYTAIITWGLAIHWATALAAIGGWGLVRAWLAAGWSRALTLLA